MDRLNYILTQKKIQKKSWSALAEGLAVSGDALRMAFNRGDVDSVYLDHIDKILNTEQREQGAVEANAVIVENLNIYMTPLVSQYAYAGLLSGHTDPEYLNQLPKIPFMIDKEAKGNYVAIEIKGDSMEDDSRYAYYEGDIVLAREIAQQHWRSKLHIRKWDFIIVHRTEGILLKQITKHIPETGEITIHSLNPDYPDRQMNLKDIEKIYNVVQLQRGKKR